MYTPPRRSYYETCPSKDSQKSKAQKVMTALASKDTKWSKDTVRENVSLMTLSDQDTRARAPRDESAQDENDVAVDHV